MNSLTLRVPAPRLAFARAFSAGVGVFLGMLGGMCVALAVPAADWPQFRGPGGRAVAEGPVPPVHFGPASNVLWKVSAPAGNSSPVITGNHLLLTAVNGQALEMLCYDRRDGRLEWRRPVPVSRLEPTHRLGSPASPTPCTDGRRVYAYFGSFGVVAWNLDGEEAWRHPLPAPVVEFGTSASPILSGDSVIVVCDQDEGSFLLALDCASGSQRWRRDRSEFRRSFSTPFLWRHDDIEELIVPGSIWLRSYDPADGTERWSFSGTSRVANSTPAAGDGLLFYSSWNIGGDEGARITMPPWAEFAPENDKNRDGRLTKGEIPEGPVRERFTQMDLNKDGQVTAGEWANMADMFARAGNAVVALKPGGRGDITASHLAWKSTRSLPYVSSPLWHQGRLFTMKNGGLASSYDARTGRPHYQDERVGADGDYYSSAIGCGDAIFLGSHKGILLVLGAGERLDVRARNDLREPILATPAIVDGRLYVRTAGNLYAFGR